MKVSCICVTLGETELALRCFRAQTHQDVELVIVHELSHDPVLETDQIRCVRVMPLPKRKLGELYNIGVSAASGDCCIIWDSDDWSGPDRVKNQLAEHQRTGLPVVLSRWQMFDTVHRAAYMGFERIWEGSLLAPTQLMRANPYPPQYIGCDTKMVAKLLMTGGITMLNKPEDYIYTAHETNTCGRPHMERLLVRSTRLGLAEDRLFAERLGL